MERAEYLNRNGGRVLESVSSQSHYIGPAETVQLSLFLP